MSLPAKGVKARASTGWGRSELAADLYDEILFNGATFADLARHDGPLTAVTATDIATGSRVLFTPQNFDIMCADLGPIRIARAAAASSAVPVVLSPLTINVYGGSCGYRLPPWTELFLDKPNPPRPAARVLKREGAARVVAYCTHAVLSGPAVQRIDASVLDELVVTDTIPLRTDANACRRIRQLSIADMLAESMRRINAEESVSSIYMD